jgi:hypothetical protein
VEADDSAVKKARAASHVRDVLGIEPTADALLARLASQLGPSEIGPILEGIRHSSPDRREYAVAGVAAASLAMGHLGSGWWTTRRHRSNLAGLPEDDRSPADLIRSRPRLRQPGETGPWIDPPAEVLGYWAEDDVADHLWGQPVAYVDMNSSQPVDRVDSPSRPAASVCGGPRRGRTLPSPGGWYRSHEGDGALGPSTGRNQRVLAHQPAESTVHALLRGTDGVHARRSSLPEEASLINAEINWRRLVNTSRFPASTSSSCASA